MSIGSGSVIVAVLGVAGVQLKVSYLILQRWLLTLKLKTKMKIETSTVIGVFIGLVIGNFIWQAFSSQNWAEATERSFFQAVAFGALYLTTLTK